MSRTSLFARSVATVVAMIVAVWSTALCVSGMASRHSPHACCAKKATNGARAAALPTCCAENSDNYFGALATPAPVPEPSVSIVRLIAAGAMSDRPLDRFVRPQTNALKPPGTPTYLSISNFRL